ncbi:hypothetical protein HG535_0C03120 [Zygotorulaspora mrakii]|uniref:Carboxypeptidase n=1 Tax=Zygotorulaspora mrakii TaxID=42260 RepID=A0A7H9B005_ZYGMR|nr:uncharacterized protein HG535_0C03120 [Zygotorulaspora mrakii]QLG71960.1 hypothetical protein HG535_0C03120 [Zygotorulaspora mrakii]
MKLLKSVALTALAGHVGMASALSLFEDVVSLPKFELPRLPRNAFQDIRPGSNDEGTVTLASDIDDSYSLRIKKVDPSKLGLDTVKQWSGYLDYEESKHFFYYFFESRNDPENDPVILWLNGGPGCSSLTGLFFELGPSSIGADLKPIHNPYSWNNNASIIFLEQPLGVGFSYGDEKIVTTRAAGKDVYIFLELFFQAFPQYSSNDFHISGESYAGHYIPQIAHEIVLEHPERSFNLSSILIGNGITDSLVQSDYYEPMACGFGGYPAVLSEDKCDKMNKDAKRCRVLAEICYKTESNLPCIAASSYCNAVLLDPYQETGLNVYDIRGPCEDQDEGDMCYYGLRYVDQYLNQAFVQEALGSDVHNYTGCSEDVFLGFVLTGDEAKPFQQYVAELLDRDIPVLIYAGDKDFICNWLGNRAWSDQLEWKSKENYEYLPLKPWKSKDTGEEIGQIKKFGPLTFLRVYDAGHMVPMDQPESSLEMLNGWIHDKSRLLY